MTFNVLIAEDDDDDFELFRLGVRKARLDINLARVRDGVEAKEYLAGSRPYSNRAQFPLPDLILADLKMPRCTGFELLKWLRAQPLIRRIPCVVLSSSNQQCDVNDAFELGANSYLAKPGDFKNLIVLTKSLDYWTQLNQRPDMSTLPGQSRLFPPSSASEKPLIVAGDRGR